jgi:hypothetical protein
MLPTRAAAAPGAMPLVDPQTLIVATLPASLLSFVTDALRYDGIAVLVLLAPRPYTRVQPDDIPIQGEPEAILRRRSAIQIRQTRLASADVQLAEAVPGGYRYRDLLEAGAPLTVLLLLASDFLLPVLFPF